MFTSVALLATASSSLAYVLPLRHSPTQTSFRATSASPFDAIKSWQKELDEVLDIDTSCDTRRDLILGLFGKTSEIVEDVQKAVVERDISILAPPSLAYGKSVEGLKAVQRQILSDVIPDIISNGLPSPAALVDKKQLEKITEDAPGRLQKLVEDAQELVNDPSVLQSTADDIQRELKNIVRSTPEGLEQPTYSVLTKTADYEVRQYEPYSVCRAEFESSSGSSGSSSSGGTNDMDMDMVVGSQNFNTLAGYIFGDNSEDEALAMTTPVFTRGNSMEFVLGEGRTSESAPLPKNPKVALVDVPGETVAARAFPGLATSGEVSRQRAALEDALLSDGLVYDNLSFKVAQFNPPYTLPWQRRNEVSLSVIYATAMPALESESDSESESAQAPAQVGTEFVEDFSGEAEAPSDIED